jgi:DNA-binding Lrp family transcriptional regulator
MADTIAYVLVTTDPGRAKEVAQAVAALNGVHWAAAVSGPCDVIVGAKVAGSLDLSRLVARIDGLQGVTETETARMSSFHVGRSTAGVIEPP